jgi:toxin YoeB
MKFFFTDIAWEDYLYWQKYDKKISARINKLIGNIQSSPFAGLGKPEPLKFELQGKWSRRITHTHRLVYEINKSGIVIYSCRYHY